MLTTRPEPSGNGYIPTSALKEILHELDAKLTDNELDGIIEEIDEDGSGTVDFDGKRDHECQRQRVVQPPLSHLCRVHGDDDWLTDVAGLLND